MRSTREPVRLNRIDIVDNAAAAARPTTPPQTRGERERPLAIACMLTPRRFSGETLGAMNLIRFIRMSEALARRGHRVHLVVNGSLGALPPSSGLAEVPSTQFRAHDYDVVKTFFHSGFDALDTWGGTDHPFIISNLGSVVGRGDEQGVYFYNSVREQLWAIQQKVAACSRVVSILTDRSIALWRRMHDGRARVIAVPTGVDADVPEPSANPYVALGIHGPVALFAGNIYSRDKQAEVNLFWQARLNDLGRALAARGVRLVAMGPGATDHIDPTLVTHVGIVDFRDIWNWQWHADVGIVLAQGAVQDNESSKIYYYLRTGLPVVCESSVPNAWLVTHTGHGTVVEYDERSLTAMADAAVDLTRRKPSAREVMAHMVAEHSWDARAAVYAEALATVSARQG